MPKLLVTGCSGFIAKHVLQICDKRDVRCVSRSLVSIGDLDVSSVDTINSQTDWSGVLSDISCVLHLASIAHQPGVPAPLLNDVNVNGALNLAKQALDLGVNRFVFVSSIGVYGSTSNDPLSERSNFQPVTGYAKSKLEAERQLKELCQESKMELVIVRPPLVYGKGASGNFALLEQLVRMSPFLPFRLAKNHRSFISVGNLAKFLLLVTRHPGAANQDFVISDGPDVSIREFTDILARGLGKKVMQLPLPIVFMNVVANLCGKGKLADQLFGDLQIDSSKAAELLDWCPSETLVEAMSKLKESSES